MRYVMDETVAKYMPDYSRSFGHAMVWDDDLATWLRYEKYNGVINDLEFWSGTEWIRVDSLQENEDMESTDNTRVDNNVMRHEYKVLSDAEKAGMKSIKDKGLELHELINKVGGAGSREISIAKTKCQEAVMWATKHITK